ncbi:MAG TPA: hypothetical protein VN207_13180 [Ktedonobacteraceae bacterium]|nr:hypothetical protein [Ktedonobacteraceae bacterium]
MRTTKLVTLSTTPTPDFWHNPFGQFITTNAVTFFSTIIGAVIGGIIAIWIYQRQRSKKEISYQIVSDAPVLSIDQALASRVKIELDGKPVKEVTLVVFKVSNTGNTAVDDKDYKEPLTFTFATRKVISSEVVETEPKDLIDEPTRKKFILLPTTGQDFIEFPKFLLNSKQSVTFSVLLDGAKDEISKKGRIIDGNIIQLNSEEKVFSLLAKALMEEFDGGFTITPLGLPVALSVKRKNKRVSELRLRK